MSFLLSDDEMALKELVTQFGRERIQPVIENYEHSATFPKEILQGLAELSLLGMMTPEAYGGTGLSFSTYALIMQELAKYSLSVAVSVGVTGLPQTILSRYGNEAQKKKYLPDLASGEKLGAFALTEPSSGSDAAALKTSAVKKNNIYVVNGSKSFITNGGVADTYVVFVRTGEDKTRGISALVIEKGMKGFSFGQEEKKMALNASSTISLHFENCYVPMENLVGQEGEGFSIAMQALNGGRITIGAESVGLATRAFEEARDYAKLRKQFGKSISEFQAIQIMLVDMAIGIESASLLVRKAAFLRDKGIDYVKEASMAKTMASDMAMMVTTKAVQIFGGNGYCEDYPVARLMREAKVLQIVEGTNQIQRLVIAKKLL